VNACTGRALIMSNGLDYCFHLLKILLDHWKTHLASKEVNLTCLPGFSAGLAEVQSLHFIS